MVVLHPAVELLLARMESSPEKYDEPTKWTWSVIHVLTIATPHEAKLVRTKLRELGGDAVHAHVMREVLE